MVSLTRKQVQGKKEAIETNLKEAMLGVAEYEGLIEKYDKILATLPEEEPEIDPISSNAN